VTRNIIRNSPASCFVENGQRVSLQPKIARRSFLKLSKAMASLSGAAMTGRMTEKAGAGSGEAAPSLGSRTVRTVCSHCAVGCGILAEVENGVWMRQEIAREHPVSSGGHCCKGAGAIDMVTSDKRLKSPMKKVNGKWTAISWQQALAEISKKLLDIRAKNGPDALHFNGSAKVSNEMCYLQRKFAAFWGTNNIDHQTRICHSTTMAGVANTWGYGAMTNSFNDIRHAKSMIFIGSNAPEAHPVALQHILHAREKNQAPLIVVDPRFTKLAAKATDYIRIRPGTDVAFTMGLVNAVVSNGWEDKEFIRTRVAGYEEMIAVAAHYTPEVVEGITGIPAAEVTRIAALLASHRPTSLTWCMGGTQHHIGSSITRSFCLLQLILGNIGKSGGGVNIFHGHDNGQGASDMSVSSESLPGYYPVGNESSWQHWSRVWGVDYEWLASRFYNKEYMLKKGFTLARWYEGVLGEEKIEQYTPIRAMIQWGCGGNVNSRYQRVKRAYDMLDLIVVVDPFPTMTAAMCDTDNIYLLPSSSQYETSGSVTSSARQVQWREKIIEPIHDCRDDYAIMAGLVKHLGMADEFYKNIKEVPEDIMRESGRGLLSIGYNGISPERIKRHMMQWQAFDIDTLQAKGGACDGEYYGLPWPCWSEEHPGTPILWDISKPVAEGGLPFRNFFGSEVIWDASGRMENLLAADGSFPPGSEVKGGYPELKDIMPDTDWTTDISGMTAREALARGMAPFGNARARCLVVEFPDQVPVHREPLHSPRADLVAKYPTYEDQDGHFRVHTRYQSEQDPGLAQRFPYVLITGRMVEHMGSGAETGNNKYLAELAPDMYAEINPRLADNLGIGTGEMMSVESPEGGRITVKARVTERVDEKTIFLPYHFAGMFLGESRAGSFPPGHAPFLIGESANCVTNYGYDIVTQMQSTKDGLCTVRRA
jgi:formate dehydrogenase major subunit